MPTLVMLAWPMVVLALFATMRRESAMIWAIIAGYLILPEGFSFDVTGLPPVDKYFMLFVPVLVAILVFRPRQARVGRATLAVPDAPSSDRLAGRIFLVLTTALFLGTVVTYVLNGSPARIGGAVLPGVSPYDGMARAFELAILFGPYFLARRFLFETSNQIELLRILVIAGMAYSLLALFEIRMSPQLNVWIYGYFQHSWAQHIRGDGFRPLVFLRHGLWLGFFFFMVLAAAISLSRYVPAEKRAVYLFAGVWVLATLTLSKALGAFVIALALVPAVLFLSVRAQILVALAMATLFVAYPVARPVGLLPLERIVSLAESFDPERAASLTTRLTNETVLLERANEKPVFGWAGFGRWRAYDESGRDTVISDGIWIIELGQRGWVGFLSFFGLLIYPLFLLFRARRRKPLEMVQAGMAVILGGNLIYMLPNSTLNPIAMLMAGALAGFAQFDRVRSETQDDAVAQDATTGTRYSRFGPRKPEPEEPTRRVPRKVRRRLG